MSPRCLMGALPNIPALVVAAWVPALLVVAGVPSPALAEDGPGPGLQPAQAGREANSLLRELRPDQARRPAAGQTLAPGAPVRKQAERMRREMAEDRKKRGAGKASRQDGAGDGSVTRGICISAGDG